MNLIGSSMSIMLFSSHKNRFSSWSLMEPQALSQDTLWKALKFLTDRDSRIMILLATLTAKLLPLILQLQDGLKKKLHLESLMKLELHSNSVIFIQSTSPITKNLTFAIPNITNIRLQVVKLQSQITKLQSRLIQFMAQVSFLMLL